MNLLPELSLRVIPYAGLNRVTILTINAILIYLIFIVINHNRLKEEKSKIFLLMGIFMLMWVDCAYLARIFGLMPELSLFLLKIAWLATPLVFFCTYLTSQYLAKGEEHSRKTTYIMLLISLTLSGMTAMTDLVITGTRFTNGILDIIYGQGFYIFMAGIFILIVFTLAPLLKTKLDQKTKAFLIGVIFFYVMNMIFNITLPVFFGVTHLYFFGDYSTIFLLGFTTYAILKHELFDVKVITTEIFTVFILIILGSRVFTAHSLEDFLVDSLVFICMVIFGVLLIKSVTDEIRQRHELAILNEKLKELDARKDEFLNVAAHELRAPMTAIKGYISMLLDGDVGKLPDPAVDYLKVALQSNDRLIRLVNNLLNASRIEEGRQVYQMGIMHLVDVTKLVFDEFRFSAQEKNLKLTLDTPPAPVADTVYVDRDRIHEVISNLISNAIKYTDQGSIDAKISLPNPNVIRFEITDTGKGISRDDQAKLFQKYYRVESTIGRTIGTGLGLYISKLLVEKFGGQIGYSSEVGKGSTFWFELPVTSTADKSHILV